MLADGEFDIRTDEAGIEVWVTQMGDFMNMNTAWIDRENGVVAITDPFDSQRWVEALANEGLRPTHILYTHTHRDHTAGYAKMMELIPDIEVWGHHDSIHKSLLGRFVFGNVSLTNEWNHHPNSSVEWSAGGITLSVTPRLVMPLVTAPSMGMESTTRETCFSQPHQVESISWL